MTEKNSPKTTNVVSSPTNTLAIHTHATWTGVIKLVFFVDDLKSLRHVFYLLGVRFCVATIESNKSIKK